MREIKISYDDLVMTNEEIARTVEEEMKRNGIDNITDMMTSIIREVEENEPEALKEAPPIFRMTYIASGMYKYGFLSALYYVNEALKMCFDEPQK